MSDDPEIGSMWRHKKARGVYVVRGYCLIEASDEIGILYRRCHIKGESWERGAGITWVRPLAEFMDGRFEPYAASPPPASEGRP